MTADETARLLADAIAPISALLFQKASAALVLADNRVGDLARQGDAGLLSRTMRGDLRAQLVDQDLQGWCVEGNPSRSGELYLRHWETGFVLRFLKERRKTYPGGVPVAGCNMARRDWWSQSLQSPIPGLELPIDFEVKLLLLWDLVSAREIDQGILMRVVHTTAPGKYGLSVPIDLSVELNASGGMWDQLQFVGDEDLTEFYPDEETDVGQQETV